MSETLRKVDGRSVLRMERPLAHPPEKVWRAITEPAHVDRWFPFAVKVDPRAGGAIRFVGHDVGGGPETEGVITDFDPPKVFAYTWGEDHLRWEVVADGTGSVLVLTHTFDDHAGAASFAAGWMSCIGALVEVLAGAPVSRAGDMIATHEAFVGRFGLDRGSVEAGADGWTVRFERQLTRPVDATWAAIGGPEAAVGAPAPAAATVDAVPAGPVSAVEAPAALEYEWRSAGRPAGRVRWELEPGTGHGARLLLTQTGPAAPEGERDAALEAWRTRIESLAAVLAALPPG
ncbi:SRPBCC family protein [Pseudonocardia bannensis]|uniref:Toxin-antitoxin system toxin subunit n=1 Tax=Pseudonocardia bannensis TaxID=630973 RepID=A0A848DLV4_9PSEU|nr:SRPBCC family protein [Pseudonocardia bannensis]NMH93535.1 toxin-antitoxin system toxin subunit [Pseudonocardia bannensis]